MDSGGPGRHRGDLRVPTPVTDRATLRRRLLLVCFGLATNVGIKAVAGTETGDSDAMLRRTRRIFANREGLRRAIGRVINVTLAARDKSWWGDGTACALNSKKFGSWSSNCMTSTTSATAGTGS